MKVIDAAVGFAADDFGNGVGYVDLRTPRAQRVARVDFSVQRIPALLGREVGYAALTAVAKRIADSGFEEASFRVADPQLVDDLDGKAEIPPPLTLAYVNLRCQLNRFRLATVLADEPAADDLAARARAEVTLHVAA
ncbi:MAG: hypothetical protein JO024_04215 [Candidatus Eremiobacteraeota bacterium]|nr:hypothetical protein [Candidatus Eremiobacteraeota bacterium]MBV9737168.1 hypothetical protein [Candidatus Eremiobacteraeota bacterium]